MGLIDIPIEIVSITEHSLLPDGTVYSSGTRKSIAERRRTTVSFSSSYAAGFADTNWYAYIGIGKQGVIASTFSKVPIYHSTSIIGAFTAGTYPMSMSLPTGATPAINDNVQVFLEVLTATTFKIHIEYYNIYDETTYQNVAFQDNHNKFLKDIKTNSLELNLSTVNNMYNSTASLFTLNLIIEKPNQIHAPSTFLYTDHCSPIIGAPYLVGFYNKNQTGDMPDFDTPVWEFKRAGVTVSNLSVYVNTDVTFKINSTTLPTKVLAWVIRTDKFDNYVDMVDNYEACFADILTGDPSIGVDKIVAPIVDISLVSGTTYKIGYSLDSSKLVNGAKYRLISIVYDIVNDKVNSFISDELVCDSTPCYDGEGFEAIGILNDYDRQFNGNKLTCAIEERMQSVIKLFFPFNQWKNSIYTRLGLTTSNDIRRYLKQIKFDIYDESTVIGLGVVKNYYISETANKYGINQFTTASGMSLAFDNTWAEFKMDWRNRFESNIPCIYTTVNGSPITPQQATQYWGGKTLKVRWQLVFNYDDYIVPFDDIIEFNQEIIVSDYYGLRIFHESDEVTSERPYDELVDCCIGDLFCMLSIQETYEDRVPRKLIVNICPEFSTVDVIEEAETWVGNQLPQQQSAHITNEDEDYSDDGLKKFAKFCIDTTNLSVNSYKITAFAKRYREVGRRVTEKGNPSVLEQRITEENDIRTADKI